MRIPIPTENVQTSYGLGSAGKKRRRTPQTYLISDAWIKHVVWHETSLRGAAFMCVRQRWRPTVILRLSAENVDWNSVHEVQISYAVGIVTRFVCCARVKSTETSLGVRKFSQNPVPLIAYPTFLYNCFDFLIVSIAR